jgi:hypothetical protein
MCNISIFFCNTDIKHLQHTCETSETYVCNMCSHSNISLLFRSGGSLARGVYRCRAPRWRVARCSGGESDGRFGGEDRGESMRSRRPRQVKSVMEKEEDGLCALAPWRCRLTERWSAARITVHLIYRSGVFKSLTPPRPGMFNVAYPRAQIEFRGALHGPEHRRWK